MKYVLDLRNKCCKIAGRCFPCTPWAPDGDSVFFNHTERLLIIMGADQMFFKDERDSFAS